MIGTIYRIEYNENPEIRYIGSTIQELRYRWRDHKQTFNQYLNNNHSEIAIYPYFKEFGIENFKIIKIKEYEIVDRSHLESKEQLWLNKLKNINKNNSFKIKFLYQKEYGKKYREDNKDKIKDIKKLYRENNKDKIKDKLKDYYENNKEKIKEQTNEYRQKNKEIINEKQNEKITCECGIIINKSSIYRHKKTKKHIKFMNSK